jgi:hypothetical protein
MKSMAMEMMEMRPMGMEGMDMAMMNDLVDACAACEQTCVVCADSAMGEGMSMGMSMCMSMCLDAADMCNTTMRMMLRPNGYDMMSVMAMLEACMSMCRAAAAECMKHDGMETMMMCSKACMACVEECNRMLMAMRAMA